MPFDILRSIGTYLLPQGGAKCLGWAPQIGHSDACKCGKKVSRDKRLPPRTGDFDCLLNDFRGGGKSVREVAMNPIALASFAGSDNQPRTGTAVSNGRISGVAPNVPRQCERF